MTKENIEIEKNCVNCERSRPLCNPDYVLCEKRGVVSALHCCRKFSYDPLKRTPASSVVPKLEFVNLDL